MGFAVSRSQLQQLTRSTLQQRGAEPGGLFFEDRESLGIVATFTGLNPDGSYLAPPSPMDYYGELIAMTWDQVVPTNRGLGVWPGGYASHFRNYQDGVSSTLENIIDRDIGEAFNYGTVYSSFAGGTPSLPAQLWPNLPILTEQGITRAYTNQGDDLLQSARWQFATRGSAVQNNARSETIMFRDRYRFNRASPYGFFARLDIYSLINDVSAPSFPFPVIIGPVNGDGFTQFGSYATNATLIAERGRTPAMTWIEPPIFEIPTFGQSYQSGYYGTLMLSVDWETPAMWTARTGIGFSS